MSDYADMLADEWQSEADESDRIETTGLTDAQRRDNAAESIGDLRRDEEEPEDETEEPET